MALVTLNSGFVSRNVLESFFLQLCSAASSKIETTTLGGVVVSHPGDYPVGVTRRSVRLGSKDVEICHYLFVGVPRISAPAPTIVVEVRPSDSGYEYSVTVSGLRETSVVSAFSAVFSR